MILWSVIAGVLIGIAASGFFGIVMGGIVGAGMGVWLRSILSIEIAREVRRQLGDHAPPQFEPFATPPQPATRFEEQPPEQIEAAPPIVPEPIPQPAEQTGWRDEAVPLRTSDRPPVAETGPETVPEGPTFADIARNWLFGGNTIVRVGLAVLFVGLSFLARLIVNAGLYPIEARLATVGAAGAALLVFGFRKRIARPAFGLSLQGTGVAVLYLTVFAAARLYDLLPPVAAFAFMIVFAGLGCVLAIMQDSLALALASFLGGFAVPVLLGGESRTPLPLFAYFTVLNLAILVIAWKKSWRPLNLLGFAATFGLAALWGLTSYNEQHYIITQVFLVLTVAIYLAMALLYAHNTPGQLGNAADATLLFGPALAGFSLQAGLVRHFEFGSAFSALGFGAAYLGATAFTMRGRRAEMRLLGECLLAIGVGFVTLAIPLALDAKWTSAAWALEGAGAFWVGARQARWMPRAFGLLLQLVAAAILLATLDHNVSTVPLANNGFVGPLLIAVPMLLTAWLLRRELPHSGSSWAKTYAVFEGVLHAPWFIGGFIFTGIALIEEATRSLPAATSDTLPTPVLSLHGRLYAVMLSLLAAMALADWVGRRTDWKVATRPARLSLPLLWLCLLIALGIERHVLNLPDLAVWAVAVSGHLLLLRRHDRTASNAGSLLNGAIHAGGVWLGAAMLADSLQLGIDRAELWDTSWAGVIYLVSAVAVLAALTRWAGRAAPQRDTVGLAWPLHPQARAYWWGAAVPLVIMAYVGALLTALLAEGVTDPLPYLPLINPVDLSVGLTLVALAAWRRMVASAAQLPPGAEQLDRRAAWIMGAILGFAWLNAIWLRTAHHFLGVAWNLPALADSPAVQTGLSILWTLIAMGLMLLAQRRALRPAWLTGAGLLGIVVLKLLLVDMSTAQSWARIVAFVGVGVLMLAIGYFVPLPPHAATSAKEYRE